MPDFSVQLTRPAVTDLDRLAPGARLRILEGIQELGSEPFPAAPARKKLKGFRFPLYRLRVGDFRVLYRIDGERVTVMRVIDRKDLVRTLVRLRP